MQLWKWFLPIFSLDRLENDRSPYKQFNASIMVICHATSVFGQMELRLCRNQAIGLQFRYWWMQTLYTNSRCDFEVLTFRNRILFSPVYVVKGGKLSSTVLTSVSSANKPSELCISQYVVCTIVLQWVNQLLSLNKFIIWSKNCVRCWAFHRCYSRKNLKPPVRCFTTAFIGPYITNL